MGHRIRLGAALAAVLALAVSGCTAGGATPGGETTTPPPPPTAFVTVDSALIGGLKQVQLGEDPIKTTIPQVAGAVPLNISTEIVRNRALRGVAAAGGGSVGVEWSPIASGADLLGVSLTVVAEPEGGSPTTTPVTLWYDGSTNTVATGGRLIDPEQWDSFTQAVSAAVDAAGGSATEAAAALSSSGAPQGTGPAIGFASDGGLIVAFAGGTAGSDELLSVRLEPGDAEAWLSAYGFQALGAAKHPTSYKTGVDQPSAEKFTTAAVGTRPDIDVVGDCKAMKCVSLTFDDGPGPRTGEVIDALTEHGAAGTFFVLGNMVESDPAGVRNIALSGNEVASHTWRHTALTSLDNGPAEQQVKKNAAAIERITGLWPVMMRPPYGDHNKRIDGLIGKAGQVVVQWSVDTLDWKTKSTESTIAAATQGIVPGDIILMHDIHDFTVNAVPRIAEGLTDQGFTVVPVNEMASPNDWVIGKAYCAAPWVGKECW